MPDKFKLFRQLFEAGADFDEAFEGSNLDPRIEHIALAVWTKWQLRFEGLA